MPTPAEIMAAMAGGGTKPAEKPAEAPKMPTSELKKRRFMVRLGHDKKIVEATSPEDAQEVFKKEMGILRSKHQFEISEVHPSPKV